MRIYDSGEMLSELTAVMVENCSNIDKEVVSQFIHKNSVKLSELLKHTVRTSCLVGCHIETNSNEDRVLLLLDWTDQSSDLPRLFVIKVSSPSVLADQLADRAGELLQKTKKHPGWHLQSKLIKRSEIFSY